MAVVIGGEYHMMVKKLGHHAGRRTNDGPHRFVHMSCKNALDPGRMHHNQVLGKAEKKKTIWRQGAKPSPPRRWTPTAPVPGPPGRLVLIAQIQVRKTTGVPVGVPMEVPVGVPGREPAGVAAGVPVREPAGMAAGGVIRQGQVGEPAAG